MGVQRFANKADRLEERTAALGTGCAALVLFIVATLCSYCAGRRHRRYALKRHCCQTGLLIASWLMFGLTFINALIILVLAFDEDTKINPELVCTALGGSAVAWALMFTASELARRKGPRPRRFSKFSTVSAVFFALALMLGVACAMKTYEAYNGPSAGSFVYEMKENIIQMAGERYGEENVQHLADRAEDIVNEHLQVRNVALGTGCAALIQFAIATLCSFYAGMRHRAHAKQRGQREHCCQAGFLIASWIVFALSFVNALLILVLAFDEASVIKPELVWTALIGSTVAWMLMFGYSEMARRT